MLTIAQATAEQRAFNRGFNSYRIDAAEPAVPFASESLNCEFRLGWNKAKAYFERQNDLLRSRNF